MAGYTKQVWGPDTDPLRRALSADSMNYIETGLYEASRYGVENVVDPLRAPYNVTPGRSATSGQIAANTTAMQQAILDVQAAGGGTVLVADTILVGMTGTSGGQRYCLYVSGDNVQFLGYHPSRSKLVTTADSAIIRWSGDAKLAGIGSPSSIKAQTVYAITGAAPPTVSVVSAGSPSIWVQNAGDWTTLGLAAGDWIYIRTGQTFDNGGANATEPDAELNQVISLDAATRRIDLRWPTSKDYAQEYYPASSAGGHGPTSTTVTAWLAPFGVCKANNYVIHDCAVRRVGFEATSLTDLGPGVLGGQAVNNLTLEDCTSKASRAFKLVTFCPAFVARRIRTQHVGGGYYHHLGIDTGSTRCLVEDCEQDSDGICFFHCHEGAQGDFRRVKTRSTNTNTTGEGATASPTSSASNAVSIRTRSMANVDDGEFVMPLGVGVFVSSECVRGGRIGDNKYVGALATAVQVQRGAAGWAIGHQDISLAPSAVVTHFGGTVSKGVRSVSAVLNEAPASGAASGLTETLGDLPANSLPLDVIVDVLVAFSAGDTLSVGWSGTPGALLSGVDISTTGAKNPTLGAQMLRAQSAKQTLVATYTPAASQSATGKVRVTVVYVNGAKAL